MKRGWMVLALAGAVAAPAAAQQAGMPVWNSPKGGTGLTIDADYGKPNTDAGGGNAFGARATLGLANLTLGVGYANYKPTGAPSALSSLSGDVAFRVIGGSLIPFSVNVQGGVGQQFSKTSGLVTIPSTTLITGAVGISATLPSPGISIEPYFSPGIRYRKIGSGGGNSTNFGFAVGANVGFGMFGVHIAYDYTKGKSGQPNAGIFGVGAHIALRMPIGM